MYSYKHIIKSIAVVYSMAMLFLSCSKESINTTQLYPENADIPLSETFDFKLTYTLKGESVLELTAPLMQDFSNKEKFKYQYFPKKFKVVLTNKNGDITTIIADKAYIYKNPSLTELIGNVKIYNDKGASLETEHLYWDEKNNHIFGEDKTTLKQNEEMITGTGFDSSLDFKNVRINQISGRLKIKNQN